MQDIILSETGGLQEHQRLLKVAENNIREVVSHLTEYKINRMNARSKYDDLLSTAKIVAIAEYGLKPNHQTIINAYAAAHDEVKKAKQEWLSCKAIEIKAVDQLEQQQGVRDTLKVLCRSEHESYR